MHAATDLTEFYIRIQSFFNIDQHAILDSDHACRSWIESAEIFMSQMNTDTILKTAVAYYEYQYSYGEAKRGSDPPVCLSTAMPQHLQSLLQGQGQAYRPVPVL